jgi:phosphate-selective porin OprO/OprP
VTARRSLLTVVVTLTLCSVLPSRPAWAQSPESDPAEGVAAPPPPAGGFRLPEVPDTVLDKTSQETRFFTMKLGLAPIFDYTFFNQVNQDAESLAQVGTQADQYELRSGRAMVRGNVNTLRGVSYLLSYEYKGFDRDPDEPAWAWTDVNVTFDLGPHAGRIVRQAEGTVRLRDGW